MSLIGRKIFRHNAMNEAMTSDDVANRYIFAR